MKANGIAKWDNSTGIWSALGSGISGGAIYGMNVDALALDGQGNLYAGGYFATAGGAPANNIARWDGATWAALGSGTNGGVGMLALADNGLIYAGGGFTAAGGRAAWNLARWATGTFPGYLPMVRR